MNEETRNKTPIERKPLSEEIIRALDPGTVRAITFAEVGANGNSEFLCLVCRDGGGTRTISGHFGFEAFGTRHSRDVDIEVVAEKVPFLSRFLGTSPQTTMRGSFVVENGAWVHLNLGMGNHFFLRNELYEPFRRLLSGRHAGNRCQACLDGILALLA